MRVGVNIPVHELRAERVGVGPPEAAVLAGASLTARSGELVVLDAPSGAGSSLMLSLLAGLETPARGRISFDGADLPADWPRMRALVEQDHHLAPTLTALETVSLPLRTAGSAGDQIPARARHWLDAVGLGPAAAQGVAELSGGQQQRVAVAAALAAERPVLLLDDPTSALDADNRAIVVSLVRAAADAGTLVVVASHEAELRAAADRVVGLVPDRPAR